MRLKEIKPGMVIHCKTEEERNILLNKLEEQGGFEWKYTGVNPTGHDYGFLYLHIDVNSKLTQGYEAPENCIITEFSDLIIPELSAKEVLEILGEICKEYTLNGCGTKCPLMNNCLFEEIAVDIDNTIDICTKWRKEHQKEEKKELETEWVDVVRIIKVRDNGKKECVHEVDGYASSDDVDSPFSESEELAERELKDYVANHEGNFFATLEHICRIKE